MSKQKRRKDKQGVKGHTVHMPGVGFVTFSSSRESEQPFCCYYGPDGQTCTSTTMLKAVALLPTEPPVQYMACPFHYEDVSQAVERFFADLAKSLKLPLV